MRYQNCISLGCKIIKVKFAKNSQIPWSQRYNLILTISNQVAKTTVQETYRSVVNPVFTDINDRDDFNWKSPLVKIWQEDNLDDANHTVLLKNWKAYYESTTKYYHQHVLLEVKWNLGIPIWGSDYNGRNAWPLMKHLITNLKMTESMNTKAYKQRFLELQSYVGDVPCEICNSLGRCPAKFNKAKHCKILSNAVTQLQQNKLVSCGWRLTTKPWKEILNKLESLEHIIAQEHKHENYSTGSGGGNRNKRKRRGRNGEEQETHRTIRAMMRTWGEIKNSPSWECKNCGATHPSCYNRPLEWINDPKNPQHKNKNNGWRDKNKKSLYDY